jgi:hypothetical protein
MVLMARTENVRHFRRYFSGAPDSRPSLASPCVSSTPEITQGNETLHRWTDTYLHMTRCGKFDANEYCMVKMMSASKNPLLYESMSRPRQAG